MIATRRQVRTLWVSVAVIGVLALLAPRARAQAALLPDSPLGAHAMLYFNTPIAADREMFSEAAAENAGTLRLDIFMPQITQGGASRDWSWVWRVKSLAQRYGLRIVADLTGMPRAFASCPPSKRPMRASLCPAAAPNRWGALAGEVAAQLRGTAVSFEIWNEPDGRWTFVGTPKQYGAMLASAVAAIRANDPGASITNGGMMHPPRPFGMKWLRAALQAAGPGTWQGLNMLNVHLRGRESSLRDQLETWSQFASANGRPNMPIWVTETGYPADPAYQSDPGYRGGEQAQARYVAAALHDLYDAGAVKIFVSQRDLARSTGPYASEGVLAGLGDPVPRDPGVTRRPAFYACRAFAAQNIPASGPLGSPTLSINTGLPGLSRR